MPEMTVTESALVDWEKQREAHMARAKKLNMPPREKGDTTLPPDYVDALTRPLRIEISFEDPIGTRKQLEVLAGAIVEAQVLTEQHKLGINNQRLQIRAVMKTAADTLVFLRGKTPTGRKKPGER